MASLVSVLDAQIEDVTALEKELALMNRWGHITGTQYAAIRQAILPLLPANVIIDMRSKKGAADVIAINPTTIKRFRVTNRAKVVSPF